MNNFDCLNKKFWLFLGLSLCLAGAVNAGTMDDTGSGAQGSTGTSPGTSGTSPGTSGTSPGTSGTSPGTSGTSPGTSGTSPGATGGTGRAQGMSKVQPFQAMDKNSDRYVTKSELMDSPSMLKYFDKVDIDKDGQLEESEYKNLIMESGQ